MEQGLSTEYSIVLKFDTAKIRAVHGHLSIVNLTPKFQFNLIQELGK